MKNLLKVILILSALALLCIYLFIPSKIRFSKIAFIKTNQNVANRYLTDETNWRKWWPPNKHDSSSADNVKSKENYTYKNHVYAINNRMVNAAGISIKNNNSALNTNINIVPLKDDSVAMEWNGEMPASSNPVKKIRYYLLAKKVHSEMADILKTLKIFLETRENIYGINIRQTKVTDTILVSTQYVSDIYPSTTTIYGLIKNLREYISITGATETNYPMLHVTGNSSGFKTMVAIPVNKIIAENNNILYKRMVPGKILVTEVTGGTYTTTQALKQLETYINDYQLKSPAIPFESLVTDRSKEPDTSKWITKIYYPIF